MELDHRPAGGTVTERQLDDRFVEFPRIDDRLAATGSLRGFGRRRRPGPLRPDHGRPIEHGSAPLSRRAGPGEAVFVPSASGSADESDGWYIGYVYDPARDGSDLVIIDASDFTGNPLHGQASARVPYGFHGNWITD